ncbi:MAG: sensor histidine kinase, partial [Myxococcota bacterium]
AREPARPVVRAAPVRAASVRIAIDPLLGREVPGGARLLLYRTVLVGDLGYRQGLVVDRAELAAWLRREVLDSARLPDAELSFAADATEVSASAYRHRFAEPFDALQATLVLPALADPGGAATVKWISLVLFGALALGLFALYRMVAVTVGFAERRSNFVAAVSHELKTPLTAIRMYAEMLRDGMVPDGEKQREYYGTITAESERLSRLIQNVLEFSQLERGTREVALVAGSLGPVVEEAIQVLRPHAEREGFTLEVSMPDDLPPVRFDRDALLQILFNLVDNSLKYARDASDRTVRIEGRQEQGGVRLSVRDAGPGVSEGQLSRIFEPFYRAGDELTRTAQGAGIGLALVRELAERMGAALRGVNAAGGGFEVSLLLKEG